MGKFTETRSFLKAVIVIIVAIAVAIPVAYLLTDLIYNERAGARLITSGPASIPEPENNNDYQIIYDSDNPTGSSDSSSGGSSSGGSSDGSPDQDNGDDDDPENSADLNCDGMIDECDLNILLAYYGIAYIPLSGSPDHNDDGIVSQSDLGFFLSLYGSTEDNCPADYIGDQIVNERDLNILLAFYGRPFTCVISPDFNDDGIVNQSDLGYFLSQWPS